MHYILHTPGTIATLTTHPTNIGHEDVNLLSRFVAKFNDHVKKKHDAGKARWYTPREDFHQTLQNLARDHDLLLSQ